MLCKATKTADEPITGDGQAEEQLITSVDHLRRKDV